MKRAVENVKKLGGKDDCKEKGPCKKMKPAAYKQILRKGMQEGQIALLGAAPEIETPQADEGFEYQGAIIGTSVAVFAAVAAISAARRCQKKNGDEFERIV